MSVKTPYINVKHDGSVDITGEKEGLEALGHLLITKAKMGCNLSATFSDGFNPIITIFSDDDLDL